MDKICDILFILMKIFGISCSIYFMFFFMKWIALGKVPQLVTDGKLFAMRKNDIFFGHLFLDKNHGDYWWSGKYSRNYWGSLEEIEEAFAKYIERESRKITVVKKIKNFVDK